MEAVVEPSEENTISTEELQAEIDNIFASSAVGSSTASSLISALTKAACVIDVHQSTVKISFALSWKSSKERRTFKNLPAVSTMYQQNATKSEYILNKDGLKTIENAIQRARYLADTKHSIGKLRSGGFETYESAGDRLGKTLNLNGNLITKSALIFFMRDWAEAYEQFLLAVDFYVDTYPNQRRRAIADLLGGFRAVTYDSWILDTSIPEDAIERQVFDTKRRADEWMKLDRDKNPTYYHHLYSKNIGEGEKKVVQWVVYVISDSPAGLDQQEKSTNLVRDYKKALIDAFPTDPELLRRRFRLEYEVARIPSHDEIQNQRDLEAERDFAIGFKIASEKANAKAKTVFDLQEETKSELVKIWGDVILKELIQPLKNIAQTLGSTSRKNVSQKHLTSLVGKDDRVGILDNLDEIADSIIMGDKNLGEIINQIRNDLSVKDPRILSDKLDEHIKTITKHISDTVEVDEQESMLLSMEPIEVDDIEPRKRISTDYLEDMDFDDLDLD